MQYGRPALRDVPRNCQFFNKIGHFSLISLPGLAKACGEA